MLNLNKKFIFAPIVSTDWKCLQRGTPLRNGANLVRFEEKSGYVFDDMGGYSHFKNCDIDPRREFVWIEHDLKTIIPVNPNDKVLLELSDETHIVTHAKLANWSNVSRYRVIKKFSEERDTLPA